MHATLLIIYILYRESWKYSDIQLNYTTVKNRRGLIGWTASTRVFLTADYSLWAYLYSSETPWYA